MLPDLQKKVKWMEILEKEFIDVQKPLLSSEPELGGQRTLCERLNTLEFCNTSFNRVS